MPAKKAKPEKKEEKPKQVKETTKTDKVEEFNFKGKYLAAVGRRKKAVAQIRLYNKGKGLIVVNDKKVGDYFPFYLLPIINQPLKATGHLRDLNFSILVRGGGKRGQAEAIRHGIARVLVEFDKELKPVLRAKGWLTRDARRKERKKPGLKKARRAPQWSKR